MVLETISNKYQEAIHAKLETTFDDFPDALATAISAADSIDHEIADFQISRPAKVDPTVNGSRSSLERLLQRIDGEWSLESAFRPSGTAGTAPDETDILEAALGNHTNDPGNSDTYSLSSTARKSLGVYINRGFFGEFFTGCMVDTWEFSFDGENEALWKFAGKCADGVRAGTDNLDGAITSDATSVTVINGKNYEAGARFLVESEIMKISSISGNVLTVVRAWQNTTEVTHADSVATSPIAPTHAITGSPVVSPTILTLSDVTFDVMSGKIAVAEGLKVFNDETQTTKASGFTRKTREVTAEFEMRLYNDQFHILQKFIAQDQFNLSLTHGNTAGKRIVFTGSQVEGEIEGIPFGDEEQVVTLKLVFLGSSGDDELSISYT